MTAVTICACLQVRTLGLRVNSLFCRHNRFTAECPICSKNSVLSGEPAERERPVKKPATPRSRSSKPNAAAARTFVGPNVEAGDIKLEKVPGGLRLAAWRAGSIEKRAPTLSRSAARALVEEARERGIVSFDLPEAAEARSSGIAASEGRSGDMKEELRLETLDEGLVRLARWVFWPGGGVGWEMHDSPVLLPENRFEQVFSEAARNGLI
jgi:hypothetical protein